MLMPSHNSTVDRSKGFVSTSDQVYTSLPADSRKPAAPIDPSSQLISVTYIRGILISDGALTSSLQELLHLSRYFCGSLNARAYEKQDVVSWRMIEK